MTARYRGNGRFAPALWSLVTDDGKWRTPYGNINTLFNQAERELKAVMEVVRLAHIRHHPLKKRTCELCEALDRLETVRNRRSP